MAKMHAAVPLMDAISLHKQNDICGDILLSSLANQMEGFNDYRPFFTKNKDEMHDLCYGRFMCDESYKYLFLKLWKEKRGHKATNRELIDLLLKEGYVQLAQEVVSLLASEPTPELALDILKRYLPKYYSTMYPPAMPAQPYELPYDYSWFCEFNDVAIPLVAQVQIGETTHHVTLEDPSEIFQSRRAALIKLQGYGEGRPDFNHLTIVQGVAGSGKSTLCWNMSKKWIKQQLFQEFPIFLYTSLSDPRVQSAKSIADLIPHPCEKLRKVVADYINKTEGEGVALVIDGVDEVPVTSGDVGCLFLEVLIDAIFGWKKAAILITTRPHSCQLEFLMSCLDDYELVSMNGFSFLCALEYIPTCMENDLQKKDQIQQVLKTNLSFVALCQLPFNAFLASQLVLETTDFSNLPQTQTELVSAFLLLFVRKCTKLDLTVEKICEIVKTTTNCFDWLPPDIREGLKEFGKVAVDMKSLGRATVSKDSKPDSLSTALFTGLMQGTISFDYKHAIDSMEQRQYRFPHRIIQEFFLACSFQYLESARVTQHLQEEIKQCALSPVLPFYAGLTGLHKLSCLNPLYQHLDPTLSHDPGTQATLLLLLTAVYESQSRYVLQYVLYQITVRHNPLAGPVTLELSSLPAYIPHSIYCVLAYFIINMSFYNKLFTLKLANNSIANEEICYISFFMLQSLGLNRKGMSKGVDVILLLDGNAVSYNGIRCLCNLMKHITFSYISLQGNWNKDITNIHETLRYLVEDLASFPTLRGLDLSANNISGHHIQHIMAMLAISSSLQCLSLSNNDIGCEFSSLAAALSSNTVLCGLSISHCQLSDSAIQALGNALKSNQTLEFLDISYNQAITARGLTVFLSCLVSNNKLHLLYSMDLPWQELHNSYLEFIKQQRAGREVQTDLVVENSPSVNPTEIFYMYSCSILRKKKVQQMSQEVCSFEHLETVVADITSPEMVLATMGTHVQLATLRQVSTEPLDMVARAFLLKSWRHNEATYTEVTQTLYLAEEYTAIGKLQFILTHSSSPDKEHILASCLVELYTKHPFFKRSLFFSSKLTDFLLVTPICLSSGKKEAKLEEIIQPRKLILVNGIAGLGKTTLLDYNCLKWAIGECHRDFNLVIRVPLDDSAIQRAKCLEDLIPLPYDEICKAMAKYIEERLGKGVAFMLDAIDCVSPEVLQSSYVANLLRGSLPQAAVVVAAQPGTTNLSPFKFSIQASLPHFTEHCFLAYLSKWGIHSPEIIDALMSNPDVKSLSTIPFFGGVIVNLLDFTKNKGSIPDTKTTLLKWYLNAKLISFLKHHFPSHTPPEYHDDFQSLKDFRILPPKVHQILNEICRMAFQTLKDGCSKFGREELKISVPLITDICSLGLVRVTQYDRTKYEFVHLILQEFLAALHLASYPPSDISDVANFILPFLSPSFLFSFLSGLIGNHICVQEVTLNSLNTIAKALPCDFYQHRLLLFLHCIYESRSMAWCENVFQCLHILEPSIGLKLKFGDMPLSLSDCLVVRYFYVLCVKKSVSILIDLTSCTTDEEGLKVLTEAAESLSSKSYSLLLLPGKTSSRQQAVISWKEIPECSLLIAYSTLLYGKRSFQSAMSDLLEDVSPKQLSKVCSDIHLLGVANEMKEWKHLVPAFLTDEAEIRPIEERFQTSEHQKFVMLKKWKDMNGADATYHEIIRIFMAQRELNLAGVVKHLLLTTPSQQQVFDLFCYHLRKHYQQLLPPLLFDTIPFHFIEPQILFQAQHHKYSRLDKVFEHDALDVLQFSIPVADIFKVGQLRAELQSPPVNTNPVIILEGLAGSGKTTLVWYMCQKWASHEYYKDFHLLLSISSSDPMIHSAKSLPDFIPHCSKHVRNIVAKYIEAIRGEGVVFVMDDQSELQSEAIVELCDNCLEGGRLEKAIMLISSRPVVYKSRSGITSNFQKVVLQGFSPTQTYEYLHNSLASPLSSLKQILENNPPFMALCQVPLYAAISSQMLKIFPDSSLPQTQTEMMKKFILLKTKLFYEGYHKTINLKSFADVPTNVNRALYEIGQMAMLDGLVAVLIKNVLPEFEHYIRFSLDLKLMEVCKSVNYSYLTEPLKFKFVHCTIKEFLMAYLYAARNFSYADTHYILATLGLASIPCMRVLQFYAGLSGLHNMMFLKPVIEGASSNDNLYVQCRMRVLLIESIYEAQSSYLCQYGFCQLLPGSLKPVARISLSCIPELLPPITVTAIGYFLSHIRSSTTILLDLSYAHLQDNGISLLVHHMQKTYLRICTDIKEHKPIDLILSLERNSISHQGTKKLCKLIQDLSLITSINLHGNWNPPWSHSGHTDVDAALQCIIETVSTTGSYMELDLSANNITPEHLHHLVAIVERSRSLGALYLSDNDIGSGGCLLAKALTTNFCITALSLCNSNINDSVVAALGKCLISNHVLRRLDISLNPTVSFEAQLSFLNLLKQNTGMLTLCLTCLEAKLVFLQETVDEINQLRSEMHPLKFEIFNCPTRSEAEEVVKLLTGKAYEDLVIHKAFFALSTVCSNEHLHQFSEDIESEEVLGLLLGSEDEVSRVKEIYPEQQKLQNYTALCKWKAMQGNKATYQGLITILENSREAKTASKVIAVVQGPSLSLLPDISAYLRDCYLQPQSSGIITSSPDIMVNYVPLTLISSTLYEGQSVFETITEGNVLQPGQIILIEGVAGCGKSTLVQYVGKKWAEGDLYSSYRLIIWVSLGDPEVQSATVLKDLIPFPVEQQKLAIADQIQASRGEGIAFLFDGLDELSRESNYLLHFLKELHTYLPEAAVMILSRPGALKRLTSSRHDWKAVNKVTLEGFSKSQISTYLHKCLQEDPNACKRADDLISGSHTLVDLCKVPFYACIISYLLQFSTDDIPATRTGLLKSYFKYLLLNHIDTRCSWDQPLDVLSGDFHCLEHLKLFPVYNNLKKVCKLAFTTLQKARTVFGTEELNLAEISRVTECMGFVWSTSVHITQVGSGSEHVTQKVQFVHSVMHQFLAALHLTSVDLEEQSKSMMSLIEALPDLFVPAFLAGIVSAGSNEEAYLTSLCTQLMTAYRHAVQQPHHSDAQERLILLLHCLFESQTSLMVKEITKCLSLDKELNTGLKLDLSGSGFTMEETDFAVVGYFLAGLMSCSPNIPVLIQVNSSDLNEADISAVTHHYGKDSMCRLFLGLRKSLVSLLGTLKSKLVLHTDTLAWHDLNTGTKTNSMTISDSLKQDLEALSNDCNPANALLLSFNIDLQTNTAIIEHQTQEPTITTPSGSLSPVHWKKLQDFS